MIKYFFFIILMIPLFLKFVFWCIKKVFYITYYFIKCLFISRLVGLFAWFVGFCIINWTDESMMKYASITPFYYFLGVIIGIITLLMVITIIVRIWKPEFSFIKLLKKDSVVQEGIEQ